MKRLSEILIDAYILEDLSEVPDRYKYIVESEIKNKGKQFVLVKLRTYEEREIDTFHKFVYTDKNCYI